MDRERFQAEHGAVWASITQQPAFLAAMQAAYESEMNEIATLTHAEIQNFAVPILARLRGHLGHEHRLMELAVVEKDPMDLPPETYEEPSDELPPVEAESQSVASGPFAEFQHEQVAAAAKPKRRRKKRRKRRVAKPKEPHATT